MNEPGKMSLEVVEVFPWNKNFETGIELIDHQHQKLVHLLNRLAAHMSQQAGSVELEQVFQELTDYVAYHFEAEENIWATHFLDDEWLVGHHHTHEAFIKSVEELRQSGINKSTAEVVDGIIKFLTHWLAFHILDSDMRMAKAVHAINAGFMLDQAKQRANEEMSGVMRVLIDTVLAMYDSLSSRTLELVRERAERVRMEAEVRSLQIQLKEQEKREIYISMVQASQHILNNLANQLQLFRLEAMKSQDFNKEMLTMLDGALSEAGDLVQKLSSIEVPTKENIKNSVAPK